MVALKLFKESILQAISELRVNKLRTILSLSGISIGIFCIIAVLTVVNNLEILVKESVQKLGDNVIYVQKWPWYAGDEYPWWKYWKRPVPDHHELKVLKDNLKTASATAIFLSLPDQLLKFKNHSVENVSVIAVSHEYDKIYNLEFEEGRYFSFKEAHTGLNSVIIGHEVAENLFPQYIDPIGRTILVKGDRLRVIGVVKKEGENTLLTSHDNAIIVPYNYVRKVVDLKSNRLEPFIMVEAKPGIDILELKYEIKGILRNFRKLKPKEDDSFALNQISLISNQVEGLFGAINLAGWVIGGFALLVGGFGIANIMFVSVKERTNIIGIKKALGSKNWFVLMEFLVEAVILCLIGGLLGLALVYVGTVISSTFFDFGVKLLFNGILTGVLTSVVIGVIAGFIPALSASKMDPVVAMRFR